MTIADGELITASDVKELMQPGAVTFFAGGTIPDGWLKCDGQAVSRTTYSELFAVIGTNYGVGDGSSTFNVPNFQDKGIKGKSATRSLHAQAGSNAITLLEANLPAHLHTLTAGVDHQHKLDFSRAGGFATNNNMDEGSTEDDGNTYVSAAASPAHNHLIRDAGSSASFGILNPILALNFMIKT